MNELLHKAARRTNVPLHMVYALEPYFPGSLLPKGPYAEHALAQALTALAGTEKGSFEAFFLPNPKRAFENAAPEPECYLNYTGPVLLLAVKPVRNLVALAPVPGARAAVVGLLPAGAMAKADLLGKARSLHDLQRFFDHPGFEGAPIPTQRPLEVEEIAQAAHLAYRTILEEAPESLRQTLEDFPGQVEDEVILASGVEEIPALPENLPVSPQVEALAERIAEEAYLNLDMLYHMVKGTASFYLLDRLGRLAPDLANEPGVLAVAPIIQIKKSRRLARILPKLKANYAIPLRLTETAEGNVAVLSEPPYYFESSRDLEQMLRELGAQAMPSNPAPSFGEMIDALLAKKEQPRP